MCGFIVVILGGIFSTATWLIVPIAKFERVANAGLSIPSKFTEEMRDWSIKPYVNIEVQNKPCTGN